MLLAAVAGLALGAVMAYLLLQPSGAPPPAATHFELVLDPSASHPMMALSRDCSRLPCTGSREGKRHLYLRDLRGYETRQLQGTEGGHPAHVRRHPWRLPAVVAGR